MNAFTQKADVSWLKKADLQRQISSSMSRANSARTGAPEMPAAGKALDKPPASHKKAHLAPQQARVRDSKKSQDASP